MVIPTAKHCPRCGFEFQNILDYSGTPIRTCPACRLEYFDKDVREPAFYDPTKFHPDYVSTFLIPLWPFGIGAIILIIVAIYIGHIGAILLPVFPAACYLYLVYTKLKHARKAFVEQQQAYSASCTRLQDQSYILRLLDYGYHIPKHYLHAHCPDLVDYNPQSVPKTKDGKIFYF